VDIIYSDKDIIVLNKLSGVAVHGGLSVSGPTVVDFLLKEFPEVRGVGEDPLRPGIVHRLDRYTSGVMVVARNQQSFAALKELFQKRLVEKTYRAIVCGIPNVKHGIIAFPIGRLVKNPTRRGVLPQTEFRSADLNSVWGNIGKGRIRGAREAITEYRVLHVGDGYSLLELKPKTGRMHQLRVHLKAIGHPVACDKKYGGKNVCCPPGANRQLLHARSLSFSFPEGRRLRFEAEPPEDFALAIEKIF
jgi:23S rRNA pseudouridine1911/1915/1917 synthase